MEKRKQKLSLNDRLVQRELGEVGGEALEGSGFENEEPVPEAGLADNNDTANESA